MSNVVNPEVVTLLSEVGNIYRRESDIYLVLLAEGRPITIAEMARRRGISGTAMSKRIKRAKENVGLVD